MLWIIHNHTSKMIHKNRLLSQLVLKRPVMAHLCTKSIWNWGRGTWPKIKIYGPPASGLVHFDFWNGPAGWPSTVLFFKVSCWAAPSNWQLTRPPRAASFGRRIDWPWAACQLDSAAQQESLKNKTVLGHPSGPFQKSHFLLFLFCSNKGQ